MAHEEFQEEGAGWVQERIDEFVGQVADRLQEFPEERRHATVCEMSEHLHAMVSARRAAGLGPAQAWEKSVEAFGSEREVGEALAAQWKRMSRIEVRGVPLSAGEKRRVWARALLRGVATYPLMLLALPWLGGTPAGHTAMFALIVGCCVLALWKMWRRAGRWTPATLFGQVAALVVICSVGASMKWPGLFGHGSPSHLAQAWPSLMMGALLLSAWWRWRETNTTRPWKSLPLYTQNPVAAEEEYRMGPSIGLAMGAVMGCLSPLWMGVSSSGVGLALPTCGWLAALAALAVLARRLLK